MKTVQSTCNYCSIACNIDFHVENNEIVAVTPTKGYPVNKGFCCIKGLNLDKQNKEFHNPTLPLIREESGERKQIHWDEAFQMVASKIKDIQKKHGRESVAFLSTGQLTTEEMALFGHIGRNYLGMNGDGNTRLCMATSVVAHKQSYGFDAPPYTFQDLELSDTLIFIGANPVVAHPVLWGRVRDNKDCKIIVIDPRRSETAFHANEWIDVNPKGDLRLLYTLANVLIEKGWINEEYIEKYTEDFEGFKNHVKKYTLEDVEEKTGISKGRVESLAKTIHEGKRVSFWWTMGVNQSYQAVRTAQAIVNLAIMTGNIGRPGTGANSLTGQCNAMGSRLFSNTTGFYGGGDYTNEKRRKDISKALGISEEMLPKKPTIPYDEIIERCITGEIKGLWIVATNPMASWTNSEKFKRATEKLEFFVVQDIYDDTESALMCHLLLPSQSGLKKEGVIINSERRLSRIVPVLEKKENELTDYDIFLGVGKALGMEDLLEKWRTPRDAFNTLKECTKGMPCDFTGIEYDMLKDSDGIQWPFKMGEELKSSERRLYEDNKFFTPSGKAKFIYEDIAEEDPKPSKGYPYYFNTGRGTVGQWHTQTRTREIPFVTAIVPSEAYININPELAQEHDINENDKVIVTSQNGENATFIVKVSRTVKKDQIYAPMHYIECNKLTPSVYDPYSKEPSYKFVHVNIKKVE